MRLPMQSAQSSKKTIAALIAATLLLCAALGMHLQGLLQEPERISAASGPRKGYYWVAAQYQIAYLQLQNQALLQASGLDTDPAMLAMRLDILESKLHVIAAPLELTLFLAQIPGYRSSVDAFERSITALRTKLKDAGSGREAALVLLDELESGWQPVLKFSNEVRAFEMAQREQYLADFQARREMILVTSLLLTLFFLITIVVMLILTNAIRQRGIMQAGERSKE